jgi:energy-coupling factor transporter ATP-binding protein EcfA2
MISLESVNVHLPSGNPRARPVLSNVSLSIRAGEKIMIVGGNGSGKTTLLQTLAGLIKPDAGRVIIERPSPGAPGPVVALLLQEPDNQFVAGSVLGELRLSEPGRADGDGPAGTRLRQAADRFELEPMLQRNPHRLSGGEKQRLALACVWLARPDILLMDEPTSYLDAAARRRCYQIVAELNSEGTTVIWASPGGEDLTQTDRLIWIDRGGIRFDGLWPDLLEAAEPEALAVIPPPVQSLADSLVGERRVSSLELLADRLSRPPEDSYSLSAEAPAADNPAVIGQADEPPVRFERVCFAYAGEEVIHEVSLEVPAGACLGITGPNGSGKTTLLHLAAGTLAPSRGGIYRRYRSIVEAGRQNIFFLFQSPERMFFAETVHEELSFGLRRLGIGEAEREEAIANGLVMAGFAPEELTGRSPLSLSFGEMRRLALAVFLTLKPKLLMMDEPTACLDEPGRGRLRSILRRFLSEGGTVVIASHDLDFLMETADRVVHLQAGQVISDLELAGGTVPDGFAWPGGEKPLVIQLQDMLAPRGVDIRPRRASAAGLACYLAGTSRTRKPT